jgi:isoleucyl-tRNA synthetase
MLLDRTVEFHQKLRNTFRFILGNLVAFRGLLKWDELKDIDCSIMSKCKAVELQVQQKYDELDFGGGIAVVQTFVIEDLSAFYFDVIKNRLYIDAVHSPGRQSAQTALYQISLRLLSLLRPVSPYLCAEVATHLPNIDEMATGKSNEGLDHLLQMRSVVRLELNRLRKEQ